jgi:AraC-like DNA-binding protein
MPLLAISHAIERREVRVRFAVSGARGSVARGERAAGAEPAAVDRAILEAAVLSVKNVLEAIARGTCRIHRVAFPFPAPRYAAIARELARCEVRYGQSWAGLALRESQLDVPLRLADAEAFREAARICQRELDQLTAAESYAARVQRLLLERQHGFPALPMAARLLHMTPRTLHRRLVAEGTSYRAILEEVRRSLAVEHLRAGRLGVAEIAHALGYSDLANFRRAFKRWEAVPPSALRPRA